ncbi:MAG: UDP-N-acetylmuramate:L-alanyl-gamma-D-glutamyl-meso-diaminopimelate ligase [Burkholderiales bacterium]
MHLHILGICGTFMGGIAVLARAAGHRVTGSDANVYPPMSTQLAAAGIEILEGYAADQIALKPELWVVGNVVTRGNPLVEEILDCGAPITSGPQWLAEHVLAGRHVLAVAGTHGKTTTTAMLAWILEHAGRRPGFLVGGVPSDFECSARPGGSELFVVEADEYDTAFFDKRSKFVHYRARTAILTNVELDHADIFPDLAAIETQFHHFVRTLPRSGLVVANGADAALARVLARGCWSRLEKFGVPDGWSTELGPDGSFDALWRGEPQGRVAWSLMGDHNRANALAAIAAARHVGVAPGVAVEALNVFRGVKRRMEPRGVAGGVAVYDDFAHHPTAIATTLAGLRRKVGAARILAVLEPRSNTMKLGVMKDALAASLAEADVAFCYTASLGWDAAATLAPLGARARCSADLDALVAAIVRETRRGDSVVVMSNGAFGGIQEKLLAGLARPAREAAG